MACYYLDETIESFSTLLPNLLSKSFPYCVQIFEIQSYQGEKKIVKTHTLSFYIRKLSYTITPVASSQIVVTCHCAGS